MRGRQEPAYETSPATKRYSVKRTRTRSGHGHCTVTAARGASAGRGKGKGKGESSSEAWTLKSNDQAFHRASKNSPARLADHRAMSDG